MPFETFYNLADDKKSNIIESSFIEFSKYGYEKASISQIIKRAGIPRGSFYQYFEDKLDLYTHILTTIGIKKHEYSSPLLKEFETMKFIDIIRALFVGGIHFYREYPLMAKIANDFILMQNNELKSSITKGNQQKSDEFFINLIEERKKKSELDEKLDNVTLLFLIHSLNVSFTRYFIDHSGMDYHDDALFRYLDQIIYFMEKGIAVELN